MEKNVSCFVVSSIQLIVADFLMPEAQQTIIDIDLIIHSSYVLKVLVGLQEYISGRTPICSSFYINYKQLSSCWSVEIEA